MYNKVIITNTFNRGLIYECNTEQEYKEYTKKNNDAVESIGEKGQFIKPVFDLDAYDISFVSVSTRCRSQERWLIVGSKTINEKTMDTGLDKIGINQKNKKKIKDSTDKTNIHSLLNILKAYYANVHQDKPKPVNTDGTVRLQLSSDTRQVLGKHSPYEHQRPPESHTY
jgi:hypothetical protein